MDNERIARAALSRLMEPQDAAGLALVQAAGARGRPADRHGPGWLPVRRWNRKSPALLADNGAGTSWAGMAAALKRWAPRIPDLAPERDLATMARLGGRLIIPSDDLWPGQLGDLGIHEPICLWWRGLEQELPGRSRSVALVGSRDSTSYGASVTGDLAYSLAQRGLHRCVRRGVRHRRARAPGGLGRGIRSRAHHRRYGRRSGPLLPVRKRGSPAGCLQPGGGAGRGAARDRRQPGTGSCNGTG